MDQTIFVCQDRFNSIMSGIYDAGTCGLPNSRIRLELGGENSMRLFSDYKMVEESEEKVEKVIRTITQKISKQAYQMVYKASLVKDPEKADKLYRFLVQGFRYGACVVDQIQLDAVFEVFSMCRYVSNETHRMLQFVRFFQTFDGILASKIGPENDVLTMIAPHFSDRLSGESWIIYDEKRGRAAVHRAEGPWVITDVNEAQWEHLTKGGDKGVYEDLWKAFFESIAIKERTNPRCQQNFLPLRYRNYMTEFQ